MDTLLTRTTTTIHTTVLKKSISTGDSINYDGICPEKYKISVINKTLLHTAYEICSIWKLFLEVVIEMKQRLVTNNFIMKIIDKVVNEFVLKNQTLQHQQVNNSSENKIKFYFENEMWSNYNIDKKQLTEITQKMSKPSIMITQLN